MRSCWPYGETTTSAAPAPLTCMFVACVRNSAKTSRTPSTPCATSATGSAPTASPAPRTANPSPRRRRRRRARERNEHRGREGMRIQASGAITGTAIDTLTEAEVAFLDSVAAADGAAEVSGGLMAIATGEGTADQPQPASSVWRGYAPGADGAAGADDAGELIGYGIRAKQGERHAAEFLIDPDHRGQGLGERLLTIILAEQPEAWCWSHGDHPAAARLADKHGLSRDRVLYQMRTDADLGPDDLPATRPPEGVKIRSFAPGDEDGWLSVNNAAFDWHPEQGSQTRADIDAIVTADDFDP